MNKFENLFLSVLLHVALALIVVALAMVAPPQRVIAPARLQIMEIDLRNVRVEGEETRLRNLENRPQPERNQARDRPQAAAPAPRPQPVMQTVRVNRETANLDRTMTVSIIDAFRIALTRCWHIDQTRPGLEGIRAVAHIRLHQNGRVRSLWFEEATRADREPIFAYVLDTIRMAIDACQPFTMLPRGEFEQWQSVQLTFFPTAKIVE